MKPTTLTPIDPADVRLSVWVSRYAGGCWGYVTPFGGMLYWARFPSFVEDREKARN